MFSLCPSASHHFSWALGVFELSEKKLWVSAEWGELLKSAICHFKISFAADVHTPQHPERGEHLASNAQRDQNCLAALPLSRPFSASRLHDPQCDSLDNACTNMGSNLSSLAFHFNIMHRSCMCAGVLQWGLARRGASVISRGAGKELASPERGL